MTGDGFCHGDANKPATGTYKAMVAAAGQRVACTTANCGGGAGEHTGWVLAANQEYRRSDNTTVIGTTNAVGIFIFPLTSSVGGGATPMTGLNPNWTTSADTCTGWTSGAGNYTAGYAASTSDGLLSFSNEGCGTPNPLFCVEQ